MIALDHVWPLEYEWFGITYGFHMNRLPVDTLRDQIILYHFCAGPRDGHLVVWSTIE